jgi:hypothetical protein
MTPEHPHRIEQDPSEVKIPKPRCEPDEASGLELHKQPFSAVSLYLVRAGAWSICRYSKIL